jgi:uncharacterized protein YjbI with pentapeptide repeats
VLHGTNFQNASLYAAKMQGVEAKHADFRGADLRQVNFGGAYLEGAVMPAVAVERAAFEKLLKNDAREAKATTREKEMEGRER